MEYESPEIIATYVEDELVAEATVATHYGKGPFEGPFHFPHR